MSTLKQSNLGFNLLNIQSFSKPDKHDHKLHIGINAFADLNADDSDFMIAVRNALTHNNENYASDLATAITAFENTGNNFTDLESFKNAYAPFVNSFRRIELLWELTFENIQTILEEEFQANIPDPADNGSFLDRIKIWDNIVYHTHKYLHKDFKLYLANVLRVYYIIEKINTGISYAPEQWQQICNCILKIEPGLFTIPMVETSGEETEPTAESFDPIQLQSDIKAAELLRQELNTLLVRRTQENQEAIKAFIPAYDTNGELTNENELPTLAQMNRVDTALYNNLTANSKDVFDSVLEFDVADEPLISEVFDKAQKYISEQAITLYTNFKGSTTMTAIWGNEVVVEGGNEPSPDPGQNTSELPTSHADPYFLNPCKFDTFGVVEYRKVLQEWEEYKPAEIAHIENMLAGEKKERVSRHLRRREETYTVENIREEETLRDVQTTERFALQNETQKTVQLDMQAYLDSNVNGTYGLTNYAVSGGISFGSSLSESKSQSESYAREVIDRATKRVMERFREERIIKVLEEFEDTNTHTIDNAVDVAGTSALTENMVGIYRWINKIMNCKLINYGRRLVFMFNIPEPAAFHLYAKSNLSENLSKNVIMPKDPRTDGAKLNGNNTVYLKSPSNLDQSNYLAWAALFDANVDAYPQELIINNAYFEKGNGSSNDLSAYADNTVAIPEGYYINTLHWDVAKRQGKDLYFAINQWADYCGSNMHYLGTIASNNSGLNKNTLGVSVLTKSNDWTLNIRAHCEPTNETIDKWKIKTFNTIIAAYNKMKQEAEAQLAQLKNEQIFQLSGTNPASLRELEAKELRKGCISILNRAHVITATGYNRFFDYYNAMRYKKPDELVGFANPSDMSPTSPPSIAYPENWLKYPEFIPCKAIAEGRAINFFENAFDWKIMSYKFNPYYWADKKRWPFLYNINHDDPLFNNFLQAGSAMVLVPVKEGYENAVTNFVQTGSFYETPSGVQSIEEAIDALIDVNLTPLNNNNVPEWNTTVPTQLVMLQERSNGITVNQGVTVSPSELNEFGLPINPDV